MKPAIEKIEIGRNISTDGMPCPDPKEIRANPQNALRRMGIKLMPLPKIEKVIHFAYRP